MKSKDLLSKKNVVLFHTGKKEIGGVVTSRNSIRVGVSRKLPLSELAKSDVIPKRVGGILGIWPFGKKTDVFETPEIWALGVDRKAKHRPSPGGVSIGHPNVTAGSQGPVVRKAAIRYILDNKHVFAPDGASIGDQIWQPGSYDGGGPADTIAHLSAFVPIVFFGDGSGCLGGIIGKVITSIAALFGVKPRAITNKVDCAIARPIIDEDVLDEILEIGVPTGFGEAKTGDKVKKSGRTTGLTQGDVIGTDGGANVNYGDGKIAIFEDQIVASAMSEGGDSGSGVLNEPNEAVGLLFAGSSSLTIINKIANVIDALGLDKTL